MIDSGPIRLTIAASDAGEAIGAIAARAVGEASAAMALAHGGVWIGRQRAESTDQPVAAGDMVAISRPPTGSYATVTVTPDWIVYEDADLIALDKPAGTYVDATPWDHGGHLRSALEHFLAARDGAPPRLHLAHRLDRDTSGVLLFSKSPAVNPALQAMFATGLVHKRYICRCIGVISEDTFDVVTGHGRGAKGHFRVYPLADIGQALPTGSGAIKRMATHFTVVRRDGDSTLVQAEPLTGRTHQIRLHMAHIGHPLLGDSKYGGPTTWRGELLCYHLLHATELTLPHPHTGVLLRLTARPVMWAQ